jgi:hypothetical protein
MTGLKYDVGLHMRLLNALEIVFATLPGAYIGEALEGH